MKINEYLESLLGNREAKELQTAIRSGKVIIIDGPQEPTGKTVLCSALQKNGVAVFEAKDVYKVTLSELLKERKPNFENLISF